MSMTKKRLIRLFIITVICLIIAGAIATYQIKSDGLSGFNSVVASNFGGEFTLTNQDGETVTDQNFRDQYRLIYFGFTYCPAICPTELQRIAITLKTLGHDGNKIQPMFITIDPERDTAQIIKNYIAAFHPKFIGLTGTPEQIKHVTSGYKIYAAKVPYEHMEGYTMDHSSFIYFMGPNDDLLKIFKSDDSMEDMIKDIRKILNKSNLQ